MANQINSQLASGHELDALAQMYGCRSRYLGEPDATYREAVTKSIGIQEVYLRQPVSVAYQAHYRPQTKRESFIEAMAGTLVGLVIAFFAQWAYFTATGFHVPMLVNVGLVAWMTVVSIVRSYYLRRFFDWFFPWLRSKR